MEWTVGWEAKTVRGDSWLCSRLLKAASQRLARIWIFIAYYLPVKHLKFLSVSTSRDGGRPCSSLALPLHYGNRMWSEALFCVRLSGEAQVHGDWTNIWRTWFDFLCKPTLCFTFSTVPCTLEIQTTRYDFKVPNISLHSCKKLAPWRPNSFKSIWYSVKNIKYIFLCFSQMFTFL